MADLDCEALDGPGDDGEGGKEHRVAITRDHLGGNWLDDEAKLFGDIGLHRRIDIGESSDRARYRAGGDLGARRHQPRLAAVKFGVGLRELKAEGGRFGMDAVAAPDSGRILVLHRAPFDRGEQVVEIGEQDVAGAGQLHRQGRVEHVRAGHALMHEARLRADLLGYPVEEGDHVVLGHCLDGVDGGDVDLRIARPPVPQRLARAWRHHAKLAHLDRRMGLDLEPDAKPRFGIPERAHRGAGIARDHGELRLDWTASPLGRPARHGKRWPPPNRGRWLAGPCLPGRG
jgi:hypothetical protein